MPSLTVKERVARKLSPILPWLASGDRLDDHQGQAMHYYCYLLLLISLDAIPPSCRFNII